MEEGVSCKEETVGDEERTRVSNGDEEEGEQRRKNVHTTASMPLMALDQLKEQVANVIIHLLFFSHLTKC